MAQLLKRRPKRLPVGYDIDRINEIANGLVVASLSLQMRDGEAAERAVNDTLVQASAYLSLAMEQAEARANRRRAATLGVSAVFVAALAAGMAITPPAAVNPGSAAGAPIAVGSAPALDGGLTGAGDTRVELTVPGNRLGTTREAEPPTTRGGPASRAFEPPPTFTDPSVGTGDSGEGPSDRPTDTSPPPGTEGPLGPDGDAGTPGSPSAEAPGTQGDRSPSDEAVGSRQPAERGGPRSSSESEPAPGNAKSGGDNEDRGGPRKDGSAPDAPGRSG